MIATFPLPYPAEAFYSICARYTDRMGFAARYTALTELFGTRSIRPVIDLPTRLDDLVSSLPPLLSYTADYFVKYHTLLPLFMPFFPSIRLEAIVAGMIGQRRQGINLALGTAASRVKNHSRIVYCPLCSKEDRKELGETYWRQNHLAPGVYICTIHNIQLEHSVVPSQGLRYFVSAEAVANVNNVSSVNFQDPNNRILHSIANEVKWALENPLVDCQFAFLRKRYLTLLAAQGFASHSGHIKTQKLVSSFQAFYEPKLLKALGCEIEDKHTRNWVAKIAQAGSVQHPLRHILLLTFLQCTLAEFFKLPLQEEYFTEDAYPCLNPICHHYNQRVIAEVDVTFSRKMGMRPKGTFVCPYCGFTYCRVGPDTSAEALSQGKVVRYGMVWERELFRLWSDTELTGKEKAHRLGVGQDTLKRQAVRLGLDENPRRQQWQATASSPKAPTTNAQSNLLQPHKQKSNETSINWAEQDLVLQEELAKTLTDLRNQNDRGRITTNRLTALLGLGKGYLRRNIKRLPITSDLLNKSVESVEDYALRRIENVKKGYLQAQSRTNFSGFVKAAGLSQSVQSQSVLQAVQEAVQEINRAFLEK